MIHPDAFEGYLSPMTWRYGSEPMRAVWSEVHKRRLWRRLWVALAAAQAQAGLVSAAQVDDLRAHQDDVDIARAHALEAELQHDLMAEVHAFAEQCPLGGGVIHLGATSMDIEDNADALRIREALDLLLDSLHSLIAVMADRVEALAHLPTMAYTHLQPAEPTTVGYRLAQTLQDLCQDLLDLQRLRAEVRGKGLKGAVGTSASYAQLLAGTPVTPLELEAAFLAPFDLPVFPITTQTYPRKQDYRVLSGLAQLAQTLYRFAFDLRLLQSPAWGEWAEPFGARQIGSSAMPFKRNPIHAENIDSLGRLLAAMPRVAWDNAAHSLLERTLDDSANRRTLLPESCLIADEMLRRARRLVTHLQVDADASARQLQTWGAFAATERLLMEAARRGGDRQHLHEVIRQHAMTAWAALRASQPNPLIDLLIHDPAITALLTPDEARAALDASGYVGHAPALAAQMAAEARNLLNNNNKPS